MCDFLMVTKIDASTSTSFSGLSRSQLLAIVFNFGDPKKTFNPVSAATLRARLVMHILCLLRLSQFPHLVENNETFLAAELCLGNTRLASTEKLGQQ